MRVSVIIATHNRHLELQELLTDLSLQAFDTKDFEVLIIDSEVGDDCSSIVEEAKGAGLNASLWLTDNILAAKRNYGASKSRGRTLIFLDDDLRLGPDFIQGHMDAQKNPTDLVSGQVRFPEEWVASSNYYRYKASRHMNDDSDRGTLRIPGNRFVAMNCSVAKDEFERIGGFDVRFQRYGGEDVEFGLRALRMGMTLVYSPQAIAWHFEVHMDVVEFAAKNYKAAYNATPLVLELAPEAKSIATYKWTESGVAARRTDKVIARIVSTLNRSRVSIPLTYLLATSDRHRSVYMPLAYKVLNILSTAEGSMDREKGRAARATQYQRFTRRNR